MGQGHWGQDQGTPGHLPKTGSGGLSTLANDHGRTLTGLTSPEHGPDDEPDANLSAGAKHQDGPTTDEDDCGHHPKMLQGSGTDDQGLHQLELQSSCGHAEDSSDPDSDAAVTAEAHDVEGAAMPAAASGDTASLAMSLVGNTLTVGVVLPVMCCFVPPAIAWSSAVIGHAAVRKACSWASWR